MDLVVKRMQRKLKKRLFTGLASAIFVLGLGMVGSNVKAELSFGGIETVPPGAAGGSWTISNTSLNQAYFKYTGTAQQNQWISYAGVSRPTNGQLVIVQWVTHEGKQMSMASLSEFYTYSNSLTTRYYTDGSADASAKNWSKLVSLSGATQRTRVLALAGGSLGIGNNTLQDDTNYYAVAGGPFWFSGTYGAPGGYPPGAGAGTGAGSVPGVNRAEGGILVKGNQMVTVVRGNIKPDVVLPPNGKPDTPTNKLGISKAATVNGVSTSSVVKSKSSNDDAQYDISFDFMSRDSHVYYTYAWAVKDESFKTKTIEQNYQSVLDITDTLPKGFKVSDIGITTKDGRTLSVQKAKPGAISSNVTNDTNKDFAKYWIDPAASGTTGEKLHVQYVTGDHTESTSTGKLNNAKITIKGKLVPTELPTPNATSGVGRLVNTASVNQTVQVWNREHTSGAGTKAQPYKFTSNDKTYIKKADAFKSNKGSNNVAIDVQSYQLTARYMTLNDQYQRQGNLVNVPISGKSVNTWNSGWVYPHVTKAIPTPTKTTAQTPSAIYDRNADGVVKSTNLGAAWTVKNAGKDNKVVTIPNSQPVTTTVDGESLLNTSTYTSTWYRNLVDLQGNVHSLDQVTDLTTGKTTDISTAGGETTNYTMPDSSQALSVYYGQKGYDVNVHHFTSKASTPSYTSFDKGSDPIVSGLLVNEFGPNVFQRGLTPHVENYRVHEGESLNYNPQVTSILQDKARWSLDERFTGSNQFAFKTGTTPQVDNTEQFASVSLEYEKDAALNQGSDINLNPEKLTIDTAQTKDGLPFELDLKATVGGQWKWFESLNVPGFDLEDYTYNVVIKRGDKTVYTSVVTPDQMQRNDDVFTKTLKGTLSTEGAEDGQKVGYVVSIVPDTSNLKDLEYTGPEGNVAIHVPQTMETETDEAHAFNSAGYTASNLKLTADDVTKDGQLSIPDNKMVVQTVATRNPYSYIERHENWTLSVPKDLTTLTGYSMSGEYPISYSVDKASGRDLVDLNNKFQLRYSKGLNADTGLDTYVDEKSGAEVDPNDKSATLALSEDGDTKDVDANGVLTRFATQATPDVSVEDVSGKVSSKVAPDGKKLKDGGSRIYISDWIKNVPSVQPMIFESRPNSALGVNNVTFEFTQNVTLSGYLHGHAESDTSATDALLMQPVDRGSVMPVDGFTYTKDDNKWLTNDNWFK